MDIVSEKTLKLLREKVVRATIDELIDQRTTESKTVELRRTSSDDTGPDRPVRILIRRIA
jgi:hypothetical protein